MRDVFSGTVGDNLLFGRPDATRNEMIVPAFPKTACRMSGSSWCKYWWATVKLTRYLRSSENMLTIASVVTNTKPSTAASPVTIADTQIACRCSRMTVAALAWTWFHLEELRKNADFKKVWEAMLAFRNEQYLWWRVAEYSYDDFLIRNRTRT